jgi:hypothetical protein
VYLCARWPFASLAEPGLMMGQPEPGKTDTTYFGCRKSTPYQGLHWFVTFMGRESEL